RPKDWVTRAVPRSETGALVEHKSSPTVWSRHRGTKASFNSRKRAAAADGSNLFGECERRPKPGQINSTSPSNWQKKEGLPRRYLLRLTRRQTGGSIRLMEWPHGRVRPAR